MNWQQWKTRYQRELQHPAGFEEKFVDLVLMNIPNLQPSDVIPQYHFKDSKGKNRYVDFMIINTQKNWLLPIELDGYAKMVGNGDDYERFQDFLERQNALIRQFGLVLRYTNKAMFNQSSTIIAEVTDTLHRQSQDKSTRDIQETNIKQTIQDYEQKISQLQANNSHQQNKEMFNLLASMQSEIRSLKETNQGVIESDEKLEKPKSKIPIIVGLIVLFGILYIGLNFPEPSGETNLVVVEQQTPKELSTPTPQEPVIVEREVIKEVPVYVEPPKPKPEPIKQEPVKTKIETTPKPVLEPIKETKTKYTVGEIVTVCGKVSEVKYNQSIGNNYLNINGKYPNQEITFTVWINEDLSHYTGKSICTYGNVQEYKGRLSINVNSLKGLKEN